MRPPRTIKKYPNRRLYDTVESRYVTLQDVRGLIRDRIEFVVVDRKTDEDITNSVLLQVISEEERCATPLLGRGLLSKLIRAYGTANHGSISGYLEESLTIMLAATTAEGAEAGNDATQSAAQKNFDRWRALQEDMYRNLVQEGPGRADLGREEAPNDSVAMD